MRAILLVLTEFIPLLAGCSGKHFPEKPAVSMQVTLWEDPRGYHIPGKEPTVMNCEDAEAIAGVAAVLNSGTPNKDHKCGPSGSITVLYDDGNEVRVTILPGHHRGYYEFRDMKQHNYRVPQEALFSALKDAGIDTAMLPKPRLEGESR